MKKKKEQKRLNNWDAISKRVITVKLKCTTHLKTIITVYGPSDDDKSEEKYVFSEELILAVEIARGEIYVTRHFSGIMKTDSVYTTAIGNRGENERNQNRKLLNLYALE